MINLWWQNIVKYRNLLYPHVISSLLNIFIVKSVWLGMVPVGITVFFFIWVWILTKMLKDLGLEDLSDLE